MATASCPSAATINQLLAHYQLDTVADRDRITSVRTFTVAKFDNFEEADRAEKAYYLSLTPEQRLRLLGELCSLLQGSRDEPPPRLARVYRIIELPRR